MKSQLLALSTRSRALAAAQSNGNNSSSSGSASTSAANNTSVALNATGGTDTLGRIAASAKAGVTLPVGYRGQ
ncbi:hypothetical protein RI103_16200 [Paraburkholderia sp. FT54]|uniref:hypothetical protein n=1 Tax=Paraburkholderia sp. FT54 TaxID=3074437 RepID=UPI002877C3A9|nr:hypothetical protein [Paraburkholderia sp. FT54]WNC89207.1 hypothetical protein RI103_16200 [Paraburkholderia sp. FT54]